MTRNLRTVLIILGVLLLGFILWFLSNVVIYFLISAILALIGRPIMVSLSKIKVKGRGLPDWTKSAIVLILYFSIIAGFVSLLVPVINEEIKVFSAIDINKLIEENKHLMEKAEQWYQQLNPGKEGIPLKKQLASYLDFSFLEASVSGIFIRLGNVIVGISCVLFMTFFLLKDDHILKNITDAVTPDAYLKSIYSILDETRDLLRRYFLGIVIQISIVTVIVWGGLTLVGISNALFIGLMAGLLNIIPYVGPLIAAMLGVLLGVTSNLHLNLSTEMLPLLLKILSVYGVAQLLDNFILQPLIFSKSVKAHPLEIFIVTLIAGTLGGILAMIVAVPFYSFLRIIAKEFFQGYKIVQGLTGHL